MNPPAERGKGAGWRGAEGVGGVKRAQQRQGARRTTHVDDKPLDLGRELKDSVQRGNAALRCGGGAGGRHHSSGGEGAAKGAGGQRPRWRYGVTRLAPKHKLAGDEKN